MPPRIAVTPLQIDQVVAAFYKRVRGDGELGAIFAEHVADWPAHEAKIAAFWRNALLFERSYDGNPMRVHQSAGSVRAAHFAVWLRLFDEVLFAQLPTCLAESWSALAHRIGRGLRYGLPPEAGAGQVPLFGD